MAKKIKIATKLHRQFSHPNSKKLCNLVKNAWVTNPEFIKILQTLPSSCEVCIRHKKTEPKPIVGFTLGSYFNENVMDIKEISGNKVLHLVDHFYICAPMFNKNLFVFPPYNSSWTKPSITEISLIKKSRVRVSAPSRPSPPLYPHFNRPSGFWPCVKSCLVGGSDKYMVDHATRYSVEVRISSKESSDIISARSYLDW